jgi:hypothetical protein
MPGPETEFRAGLPTEVTVHKPVVGGVGDIGGIKLAPQPDAYYLEKDDVSTVSGDWGQLVPNATLKLPAGSYTVIAKAVLTNISNTHKAGFDCRLMVDGLQGNDWVTVMIDTKEPMNDESAPNNERQIVMMMAGKMETSGHARLICRSASPGARISMIRMSALKAERIKVIQE